jgi:hypothetical protein
MPGLIDPREWLIPPTEAWWYWPLSIALLILLAAALICWLWPGRFSVGIDFAEQVVARRTRLCGRLAPFLFPGVLALVWFVAPASLILGPRPPRVVVLQASGLPLDRSFWNGRVPREYAGCAMIDAGSDVVSLLARLAPEGAKSWSEPTPARRERLRQAALAILKAPAKPELAGHVDGPQFPAWVVEEAELAIVQGLIWRENVRWVGVRVDSDRSADWKNVGRLLGIEPERWKVEDDGQFRVIRVRDIFDARRESSGNVRCRALLRGPVGTPVTLKLNILDRSGSTIAELHSTATIDRIPQVVEFSGQLSSTVPDDLLSVATERGEVRTLLAPSEFRPISLAVVGPGDSGLVRTWEAVKQDRNLEMNTTLQAEHRLNLQLKAQPPAPGEPTLILQDKATLLLPPGLDLSDLPADLLNDEPLTGSMTRDQQNGSLHVSRDSSGGSMMSTGWRITDIPDVPRTADWIREVAGGCLMNQPIKDGRLLAADVEPILWPIVEIGQARNRPFVVYRMAPALQGLIKNSGTPLPEEYEPARARAFFASLSWGLERVLSVTDSHVKPPRESATVPLLTFSDVDDCVGRGRKVFDALALALIGAVTLALILRSRSKF